MNMHAHSLKVVAHCCHSCTGAADFDFADGGARVRCGTCGGAPGAAVTSLLNRNKRITDRNCSNLTVTSVSLMRIRTPATDDLPQTAFVASLRLDRFSQHAWN